MLDRWSGSGWTPTQIVTTDHFANGLIHTQDTTNGTTRTEFHDLSYLQAGVFVNGNRTSDTFTRQTPDGNTACDNANCSVSYTYDGRDRLASTTETTGTAQTKTDYTLDTAGNVITETVNGQMVRGFRYVGNQLTEIVTPAGVTAAKYFYTPLGATDCVTDAQGSPDTCKSFSPPDPHLIKKYRYDDLDRLRAAYTYAATTTDTATYDYDPIDRLLIQGETHTGELTRTTSFDYLGLTSQVAQETQKNPVGAVLSTKAYTYDPFGRRLSMLTDTAQSRLTYGYDTHGSVTQLLDQAGKVRAAYGYTAYGNKNDSLTRGDTNPTNPVNAYRFTHQRLDPGAGNLAIGNRRFGPDIGRFLQRDSYYGATANLGLSLDPLTQNRYSFAGGNPVSYIDWSGHQPFMLENDCGGFICGEPEPVENFSQYGSAERGIAPQRESHNDSAMSDLEREDLILPQGQCNSQEDCEAAVANMLGRSSWDLGGTVRNVANRGWHVARFAKNALPTAAAVVVSEARDGNCHMRTGLMVECDNVHVGWGRPVTVGGTIINSDKDKLSEDQLNHETKHGDQEAIFGSPGLVQFVGTYATSQIVGWAISSVTTKNEQIECYSPLEWLAGLRKGDYKSCSK